MQIHNGFHFGMESYNQKSMQCFGFTPQTSIDLLTRCFLHTSGVRDAYFPVYRMCSMKVYQDAHCKDGELPDIKLEEGAVFEHVKCLEDICNPILEAHNLIYIVGWSIYHMVKLVREPTQEVPHASLLMLRELLKYISEEGVPVCMLVWDDKTSHNKFCIEIVMPYMEASCSKRHLLIRLVYTGQETKFNFVSNIERVKKKNTGNPTVLSFE